MKRCIKCGSYHNTDTNFCMVCGKPCITDVDNSMANYQHLNAKADITDELDINSKASENQEINAGVVIESSEDNSAENNTTKVDFQKLIVLGAAVIAFFAIILIGKAIINKVTNNGIYDEAEILTDSDKKEIKQVVKDANKQYDIDFAVATTKDKGYLNTDIYSYSYFNSLVEDKKLSERSILTMIDVEDSTIFIVSGSELNEVESADFDELSYVAAIEYNSSNNWGSAIRAEYNQLQTCLGGGAQFSYQETTEAQTQQQIQTQPQTQTQTSEQVQAHAQESTQASIEQSISETVSVSSQKTGVYDYMDYLMDYEEEEIEQVAKEAREKYGLDFAVVTTGNKNGEDSLEHARKLFATMKNEGKMSSYGVLTVIDVEDHAVWTIKGNGLSAIISDEQMTNVYNAFFEGYNSTFDHGEAVKREYEKLESYINGDTQTENQEVENIIYNYVVTYDNGQFRVDDEPLQCIYFVKENGENELSFIADYHYEDEVSDNFTTSNYYGENLQKLQSGEKVNAKVYSYKEYAGKTFYLDYFKDKEMIRVTDDAGIERYYSTDAQKESNLKLIGYSNSNAMTTENRYRLKSVTRYVDGKITAVVDYVYNMDESLSQVNSSYEGEQTEQIVFQNGKVVSYYNNYAATFSVDSNTNTVYSEDSDAFTYETRYRSDGQIEYIRYGIDGKGYFQENQYKYDDKGNLQGYSLIHENSAYNAEYSYDYEDNDTEDSSIRYLIEQNGNNILYEYVLYERW